MTLEQSSTTSSSETTDKNGTKITTKRTVKTYIPRGSLEKNTPWGVTLKPVPRKSVIEEKNKSESGTDKHKSQKKPSLPKVEPKTKSRKSSKVRINFVENLILFHNFIICLPELQKNL